MKCERTPKHVRVTARTFDARGRQRLNDSDGNCFRDCNDSDFQGPVSPPTRTGYGGSDTYRNFTATPTGSSGGAAAPPVRYARAATKPVVSAGGQIYQPQASPTDIPNTAAPDVNYGAIFGFLVGDPLSNPLDAAGLLPPLKALRAPGWIRRITRSETASDTARGGDDVAGAVGRGPHAGESIAAQGSRP